MNRLSCEWELRSKTTFYSSQCTWRWASIPQLLMCHAAVPFYRNKKKHTHPAKITHWHFRGAELVAQIRKQTTPKHSKGLQIAMCVTIKLQGNIIVYAAIKNVIMYCGFINWLDLKFRSLLDAKYLSVNLLPLSFPLICSLRWDKPHEIIGPLIGTHCQSTPSISSGIYIVS